jgi:septal ring factor EnvC (AmiA/AmiB activator)
VRKLLIALSFGVCLVAAGFMPGAAFAQQNRTLLEEQIAAYEELLSVRQAELDALAAELSATNTELDAQLAERDRLEVRVLSLSDRQERIRTQIRTLRQQQRSSAGRVAQLEAQAEGLKGQLQELIVSLHKRRSGRYVGALAQSESLFELRVRNYYLSRLTQQDVTLLETFEHTTAALGRARAQRARQVRALSARAEELEANRQALATAQANLEGIITTLGETRAGQLAQQEALLEEQNSIEGELTASRGALAAELERLREAAARQAALAETAQRDADEADEAPDDGFADEAARLERLIRGLDEPAQTSERGFAPPFPSPVVVRPYGEAGATDVWLQARQPGSAVRALRSGIVYRASRITANSGYTVAIQHGPALISAYTNLQPPVVEIGDRVEQGQILGYLGGGIVAADILQLRVGRSQGLNIIYRDPAPLLGLR